MRIMPPKVSYVPATRAMILDRQARSAWRELFARVETCPAHKSYLIESNSELEMKRHRMNADRWIRRLRASVRTRIVDGKLYLAPNDITWNVSPPAFTAREVGVRAE